MSTSRYDYRLAAVRRIVDGDTLDVTVDLGFEVFATPRLRLASVNAIERKDDPAAAQRAALYLADWLREREAALAAEESHLRVASYLRNSFGRWVADVYDPRSGESVSEAMLRDGFAVPYKRYPARR